MNDIVVHSTTKLFILRFPVLKRLLNTEEGGYESQKVRRCDTGGGDTFLLLMRSHRRRVDEDQLSGFDREESSFKNARREDDHLARTQVRRPTSLSLKRGEGGSMVRVKPLYVYTYTCIFIYIYIYIYSRENDHLART